MSIFETLGLRAELVRAVAEEGYDTPTPIQAQAIPVILQGRDVMGAAQTGTGKTAGFTLPMLHLLSQTQVKPARGSVRALVLTPTRELAAQVEESVRTYGKYLPLRSTLVFGGVGIHPQIAALRNGVDILVATPGRLLDHIGQKTVDLSQVEFLVLDEADRMLDMGFIRDIRKVLALLPAKRQNLLFSATFSDEIRKLADGLLDNPALVEVARRNADSEQVAQRIHPVDQARKRALLAHLVSTGDWRQVLVFTRTKHGANRLAEQLNKQDIGAVAIHGNKSQSARTRALADFKAGSVRVLVATDIAARGLDIESLPHVVNFELPNVSEDYVHRIGRTGRAGCTGEAISLVSSDEYSYLADIERLLKRKLPREVIAGFEPGSAVPAGEAIAVTERPPRPVRNAPRGGQQQRRPAHAASTAPRTGERSAPSDRHRDERGPNGNRSAPPRAVNGNRISQPNGTHGNTARQGYGGAARTNPNRPQTARPHSAARPDAARAPAGNNANSGFFGTLLKPWRRPDEN